VLDKYDTLNYQVLNMVAEVAFPNCTILDVGCWTGNLGEALKKRLNFAVTVDGLENNQDALKSVKGRGVSRVSPRRLVQKHDVGIAM